MAESDMNSDEVEAEVTAHEELQEPLLGGDSATSTEFSVEKAAERIVALEEQLEEQRLRVSQSERAVSIRRQRLLTNREKRDRIRINLGHLTSSRDSLGAWLHERSQSLALKLLQYVENQESALKAEEGSIRAWAELPVPTTVETAARLRKRYVGAVWWSLIGAVVIPLLLLGLNAALEEVDSQVPWVEDVWWRYFVVGMLLLLAFLFISIASYHRGFIRMKTDMDLRLDHGRYLLGVIEQVRLERARIEGLAPQLRDRLQFFGAVLQEPWRVPGFGANTDETERLNKGLPALLQIAKTAHSNDPAIIKLRAQFIAEQYRIGMRRQAIDELIRVAAERRGIPSEQADLRVIDRDSATYGLRAALHDMVRDPEVLETVGRSKVSEIASHIQSGMTPSGQRPGIARTNIDTLHGLSVNHDLLAQWSTDQMSWDEYVIEILENGAALSRLAFSPIGMAQSRHLKFQSIAVAPERLHEHAGELIEFIKIDSGVVSGTEIVARIDITPAMDVSEVALFESQINNSWTGTDYSGLSKGEENTYDFETL